jgi:hypothetical protein
VAGRRSRPNVNKSDARIKFVRGLQHKATDIIAHRALSTSWREHTHPLQLLQHRRVSEQYVLRLDVCVREFALVHVCAG